MTTAESTTPTSVLVQTLKSEVYTILANYMLAVLLVHSTTPGLTERLRAPSDEWQTLATAALRDPQDVVALTKAAEQLVRFLAPDLADEAVLELSTVLASMAGANALGMREDA